VLGSTLWVTKNIPIEILNTEHGSQVQYESLQKDPIPGCRSSPSPFSPSLLSFSSMFSSLDGSFES